MRTFNYILLCVLVYGVLWEFQAITFILRDISLAQHVGVQAIDNLAEICSHNVYKQKAIYQDHQLVGFTQPVPYGTITAKGILPNKVPGLPSAFTLDLKVTTGASIPIFTNTLWANSYPYVFSKDGNSLYAMSIMTRINTTPSTAKEGHLMLEAKVYVLVDGPTANRWQKLSEDERFHDWNKTNGAKVDVLIDEGFNTVGTRLDPSNPQDMK